MGEPPAGAGTKPPAKGTLAFEDVQELVGQLNMSEHLTSMMLDEYIERDQARAIAAETPSGSFVGMYKHHDDGLYSTHSKGLIAASQEAQLLDEVILGSGVDPSNRAQVKEKVQSVIDALVGL